MISFTADGDEVAHGRILRYLYGRNLVMTLADAGNEDGR